MKTDIHTPLPQVSTLSGELSIESPDPSRIFLTDIVTALRHENRYAGHTNEPVSVLQHSLTVWLISFMEGHNCAEQRLALWHDAPEAYIKDLPRPLKKLLGEPYREIERRFEVAVGQALDVPLGDPPAWLKGYDNRALAAECCRYRPPAACADWQNLPPANFRDVEAAELGRWLARLPNDLILTFDTDLKADQLSSVQRFLRDAVGHDWQHGAWKEVAE